MRRWACTCPSSPPTAPCWAWCSQNTQNSYGLIESLVYGVTGGVGFLLAIVLFASVRERLEFAECPKAFEGFPIALVTAGLLALAFLGFSGLKVF